MYNKQLYCALYTCLESRECQERMLDSLEVELQTIVFWELSSLLEQPVLSPTEPYKKKNRLEEHLS